MFKITPNPTFTHSIAVMVPVDGGHEEQSLDVTFNVLDISTLQDLEPGFDTKKQRAYCEAIVAGFAGLVDDKGAHVACTDALRNTILGKTYVQVAIMQGYVQAMSKAKAKN